MFSSLRKGTYQSRDLHHSYFSHCFYMSQCMRFPTMWYVRPARLRPACAYAQTDQSLCWSLEYSMTVKLLTEHHLEFLSLKGGCRGSPESTLVKMPHCWKSRVAAHKLLTLEQLTSCIELHIQRPFKGRDNLRARVEKMELRSHIGQDDWPNISKHTPVENIRTTHITGIIKCRSNHTHRLALHI